MSRGILAGRYATAFYSYVSDDRLEPIDGAFGLINQLFAAESEMFQVFRSPTIQAEDKKAFLEKILNQIEPPEEIRVFILLLLRKKRLTLIGDIYAAFHEMVKEKKNFAVANLTSAYPLSEDEREGIRKKFEKICKKNLDFLVDVDESLIAGFVVKVKGVVYDLSFRHKIDELGMRMIGTKI